MMPLHCQWYPSQGPHSITTNQKTRLFNWWFGLYSLDQDNSLITYLLGGYVAYVAFNVLPRCISTFIVMRERNYHIR